MESYWFALEISNTAKQYMTDFADTARNINDSYSSFALADDI
jgi:hypothetical protein